MASNLSWTRAAILAPGPARWNLRRAALTLAVLGLLGWTLLSVGDIGPRLRTSGAIWTRLDLLALFLGSYTAAFALRAIAWRMLLASDGPGVVRLFSFLQIALLANHLFPTKLGEVVRVGLLTRTGMLLARAAGSTLVARLLDLGALCVLAIALAPLAGGNSGAMVVALMLPVLLLLVAGASLHALGTGHLRWLWARCPARLAGPARQVEEAMRVIPPGRVLAALAVTIPSWVLEAFALWAVAQAAGIAISLPLAITATAFTIAFQGFQVTPGGIGLYEASLTTVLALHGVNPGSALALAVHTHALKFAYAYSLGLVCLSAEALHEVVKPRQVWTLAAGRIDPARLPLLRAVGSKLRDVLQDLRLDPPAPSTPRAVLAGALALGTTFALLYQLGVPLRASYGARVNVDEPFYILTTVSLLTDGDLDLVNDYALRRYRQFFDHADELWHQSGPTADGRVLSPHNVGLSVLILPAYAWGGLDSAKAFLGMIGGATVALSALLAYRATGRAGSSLLAGALLGISAPFFVYATQVYPEVPAAFLVTACAWLLLGSRPGWLTAVGLVLGLSGLAWLGSKYASVGAVLGLLALVRLRPGAAVLLLGLIVPSALYYAWFHLATYGDFTPYAVNIMFAGTSTPELVALHFEWWNRLYRLIGLWIDGEFGLARWTPALLMALPAVAPLLLKRGPVRWVWTLLFGTQFLVAVFLSITMRGWWFPGRMVIAVLPLLAIPLAVTLAAVGRRVLPAAAAGVLASYSTLVTGALIIAASAGQVALAIDPFLMPWPLFQSLAALYPVYTVYDPATWLLTAAWALAFSLLLAAPYLVSSLPPTRARGHHHAPLLQRPPAAPS
jgi:uncharacterized membrane protein YbhN (UPF0104 family)